MEEIKLFEKTILQQCADILCRSKQTIAVAESVTAGLLQSALASAENATLFFEGGITAYNARQKYTQLKVEPLHTISCNSVSETVASEMALAVSKSFLSDWGIGITGYASSLPGHEFNPLYACFAISFHNEILSVGKITTTEAMALQAQLVYVNKLLQLLHALLINMENR